MPRVCPYADEEILRAYDNLGTITSTAEHLGIARQTVANRINNRPGPKPRVKSKEADELADSCETIIDGDKATVLTKSRTIRTVEDALDYAQIDKRVWEVDRVVVNSWEVGGKVGPKAQQKWSRCQLWQVKVTLKRRFPQYIVDAIDDLIVGIKTHKPKTPKAPKRARSNPHMLEISLFDSHFGKFAWGKETGENYDLNIAEDIYFNAVNEIIEKSNKFNVNKILYPIGNDFFHVNNWNNTTARGTPQDVDTRFQKVFNVGCRAIINAIDRCLQVAPVEVIWVPGNHDPETSFYMAKVLEAWYHGSSKDVVVDVGPEERKYIHYGTSLIGFTHGDEEKHADLPNIMAGERPEEWASTKHREWHLGHFHKKKETRFSAGDTHTGVPVVVLPSLSGTDKWHYKKGYVKNRRAAVGYLWNYESGYSAHFNSTCV